MFRSRSRNAAAQLPLTLSGVDIVTVWVEPWYGVNGKSLAEIIYVSTWGLPFWLFIEVKK